MEYGQTQTNPNKPTLKERFGWWFYFQRTRFSQWKNRNKTTTELLMEAHKKHMKNQAERSE